MPITLSRGWREAESRACGGGEEVIELERRFRSMWDPSGLLNPGKVLPDRPRGCGE